MRVSEHVTKISELRQRIREADETVADWEVRDLWNQAQLELERVRLYADLVAAAYFEGDKPNERERTRAGFASELITGGVAQYRLWLEELRDAERPLVPFHWELEFPEVFIRKNPGFDAIVGNPPFGGRTTVSVSNVPHYIDWLTELHVGSHGNADVVAHFFRRAFTILRQEGSLGLLATNTIAQGDTRASGLRWICTHGGEIYSAIKRYKWPGMAAVVVSILHIIKGRYSGPKMLDGREVETVTAFLFHRGGHDDPERHAANRGRSFQGYVVVGLGFTFDDSDSKGIASRVEEMHRLIEEEPRNQEVILPYIGGEEVSTSPALEHHRYIINFGLRSEAECRREWPDLVSIVEQRVRPEREALLARSFSKDKKKRAEKWWQFSRTAQDLQVAIKGLSRVLVTPQTSNSQAFAFISSDIVFANTLLIFPFATYSAFAILQSRVHQIWAAFLGPTMKDDLRYTPSDCFETFPFPLRWETHPTLEAAGEAYYTFRADLMVRNSEGLTKTYHRFHDPEERDSEIFKLRELHTEMDRAVLDVYGFNDIPIEYDFYLQYGMEEDDPRKGRKPWRYGWPEEIRDDVLARLLALNAERAQEEARAGTNTPERSGRRSRKSVTKRSDAETLFS